jgi:mannitol/fructose-specific phosphotransferase system IIA component
MARDVRTRMFEEVAAAKAYTSSINNPEQQAKVELAAFMAIFHPTKEAEHGQDPEND